MGKAARSHYSKPPTYTFTPGILERGETMTVSRKAFVMPDPEDRRPFGRRTLTSGRKVYSWSTAPDTRSVDDGFATDRLKDEDDGSAPMLARLSDGTDGYVTRRPRQEQEQWADYGTPQQRLVTVLQAPAWQVERTVSMGDNPLPTIATGRPPAKVKAPRNPRVPAQRQASSTRGRIPAQRGSTEIISAETKDQVIRRTLRELGVPNADTVEITPVIRALALDAAADRQQRREYVS